MVIMTVFTEFPIRSRNNSQKPVLESEDLCMTGANYTNELIATHFGLRNGGMVNTYPNLPK